MLGFIPQLAHSPHVTAADPSTTTTTMASNRGVWSEEEHDRFLEAIQLHPNGPWRCVAQYVGTRDVRQVQTHAQKYYEKISRHVRGLRKERRSWIRSEHRIDDMQTSTELRVPTASTISNRLHDMVYPVKQEPVFLPYLHEDTTPWSDSSGCDLSNEIFCALDELDLDVPAFDESLEILFQCLPNC